jgi:hypothetical protein
MSSSNGYNVQDGKQNDSSIEPLASSSSSSYLPLEEMAEGGGADDSIVRRIEEEILSARKASDLARSRIQGAIGNSSSSNSHLLSYTTRRGKRQDQQQPAGAVASSSPSSSSSVKNGDGLPASLSFINPLSSLSLAAGPPLPLPPPPTETTTTVMMDLSVSLSGSFQSSGGCGGAGTLSSSYEPSFDLMEDILNIQETDSELQHHNDNNRVIMRDALEASASASPRSRGNQQGEVDDEEEEEEGFQHAMDVIGEEFEEKVSQPPPPPPPAHSAASKSVGSDVATGAALKGDGIIDHKSSRQQQQVRHSAAASTASLFSASASGLLVPSASSASSSGSYLGEEVLQHRPSSRSSCTTTSSDRVVREVLSNGETAGQRARAILDTLKSRRERFSTTFRSNSAGMIVGASNSSGSSSDSGLGLGSGVDDGLGSSAARSTTPEQPEDELAVDAVAPMDDAVVPVPAQASPSAAARPFQSASSPRGAVPTSEAPAPAEDNNPFFFGRRQLLPQKSLARSSPSSSVQQLSSTLRRSSENVVTDADEKKDDDASSAALSLPAALPAFDTSKAGLLGSAATNAAVTTPVPSGGLTTVAAPTDSASIAARTGTPTAMKRGSLPAPDKKKFKSRSYHHKLLQQQQVTQGPATNAKNDALSPMGAASAVSGGASSVTALSKLALDPGATTPSPKQPGARRKTSSSVSSPAATGSSTAPNSTTSTNSSSANSRKIRFRDPFPVLKPSNRPRDAAALVASHAVPPPVPVTRWLRPKNDLRQLIVAVMGSSIQRRAHACGALKVLTQSKKNQLTLMRTDSFLEALVFAASQDIPSHRSDEEGGDEDQLDEDSRGNRDRRECRRQNRSRGNRRPNRGVDDVLLAIDARTRAVACLRNICEPKDNRGHVILYPGFKEALMRVIQDPEESTHKLKTKTKKARPSADGSEEARVIACGAFALLAKSPECRETLVSTPGLVELLAQVMAGPTADQDNDGEGGEEAMVAVLSTDTSHSIAENVSQNRSFQTKHSSMSSHGADNENEEEDADEADDEEHSDVSDYDHDDHSHSSGHSSEYSSHPSDTENDDDDDDDDDNYHSAEEENEMSDCRDRSRQSGLKRKDRVRRDDHPRRGTTKADSYSSIPTPADELAQVDSIRRINREMYAEFVQRARSNACAALLHLSKHCAISVRSILILPLVLQPRFSQSFM